MSQRQRLQTLVAGGKTAQAIAQLLELTDSANPDLHAEVLQLSAQYNENERQARLNIADPGRLGTERNRINMAVLSAIKRLDEEGAPRPAAPAAPETEGLESFAPRTKILFVAANPNNQTRLETDLEHRSIKEELERGRMRERFEFLPPQFAVSVSNLIRAFNDKPNIVHFSGHGQEAGIIIADERNEGQLLPLPAIQRLFRPLQGIARLVLLNCCYSAVQAEEISKSGCYVVGHNLPVGDTAAIAFAQGLYNGLGEGKDFEAAYNDAMIILITRAAHFAEVVEVWKDGAMLKL